MTSTFFAVLAAVFAVSLLIVIHEAGHFWAARAFGMRVERFSVGFGPVILAFRRNGTEFAISALPLGGYVKIAGMAAGDDAPPDDRASYSNQPAWRRFVVILAGPAMNYLAAVAIATTLIATTGLGAADPSARVGAPLPGGPAALAGVAAGDRVLSVAGVPVEDWGGMVRELQRHPGQPITLLVERGEGAEARRLPLALTPRAEGGVGKVDIGPHVLLLKKGPLEALGPAVTLTNEAAARQVRGFAQIFAPSTRLSGPVGIVQDLVTGARNGLEPFFSLVWVISVVLAILNLFPFPALDGGRLVFLGYELVARRRVNARVENAVNTVGFLALIGLMLFVTVFGDLARLRGR